MAGITAAPQESERGERPMASRFSLRWDHIRALLWLRWKLTLRGYTRSTRQIVGFIFTLIFLLGLAVVLGAGTAAGYLLLDRDNAAQLLFIVLGGVWVAWAAFPLMQYTLNEGLDVTKLQIYPLTRGEQMVSLLLATLLDVSSLVLVALLVAVVVGWHASLSAVLVTLAALVFAYLLTVTTSQLLLAALMGILRSRRFRDLSVVFFALFGVSCALINQFVSRAMIGFRPDEFMSLHLDRYLQWLPTGMGARAIILADQGDSVAALPWLGMMLALVLVMVVVWAWVLDRGITTAESAGGGVRRRSRRGRPAIATGGAVAVAVNGSTRTDWRLLSGPMLAIADKDRRYFWRDPQIKASLVSTLFLLIFVMLPSLFSGRPIEVGSPDGGFGLPIASWQVFLAPIPALLITLNLAQNAFGLEREGLQTLFLFPVRPLDILRGKNLAVGVVAVSAAVLMTLAVAALGGSWSNVPIALGYAISAILVLLGCGNLISVFIPMRVRRMRMGQGNFAASGNGCLRTILMVFATQATYALLLPVAAALLLPLILSHPEWLVVTLPASLLYAVVFYELVTRLAASQLLKRAPDILMATMPDN